jgi:hypothetical protein
MESALRDLKLLWSHWQEVFTDKEMNILELKDIKILF